jgi:hypothetical protein
MPSGAGSKTVICLWGGHRQPSQGGAATPGNVDKGVRELEARGYVIHSIFPQAIRQKSRLLSRLLGRRGLNLGATPELLRTAAATGGVVYTTSRHWGRLAGRLKQYGLLRNRLVVRWAGFDADFDDLRRPDSKARRFYETILRNCDVCIIISQHEADLVRSTFPAHADKVTFWPTSVDVPFYRSQPPPTQGLDSGVVAVGSDKKRDWDLPLALAQRGIPVTILTEDPAVKAKAEAVENVRLLFKVGFLESAKIMAGARCLLLATLPNHRFSGATTVGVAAALRKPLLLDEPYDLAAYGLEPGLNCETFERGDVASAAAALDRILNAPSHAAALCAAIGEIAERLDISPYADALETYFKPGVVLADFRPAKPIPAPAA